jgi:hypothetical protein
MLHKNAGKTRHKILSITVIGHYCNSIYVHTSPYSILDCDELLDKRYCSGTEDNGSPPGIAA